MTFLRDIAAGKNSAIDPHLIAEKTKAALSVMESLVELRRQYALKKAPPKPKYPGLRAGVDPVEFLKEHYTQEIKAGLFGAGSISNLDPRLYAALNLRIKELTGYDTTSEYIYSIMEPDKVSLNPHKIKRKCCAGLLGDSEEGAVHFFGSVRYDRSHNKNTEITR